ncbi:MAG: hypothetical protein A3C02_03315 [Candidatus Andersenbacteria bacterium RIFCSPHIGHO2_02_FULL_45_11]|uniref:O-antigen ligase-related domain-containing protein n=1 Tax=Candidatus Andersenbacteria bacterium RIFCSPHIGHO2_12_FULL_45_11 TaxID=1797281 RepID=A0A1G1X4A5_9BACT|nr:MAG: hypothetical protein A2805_03880 [Candidatus Andersenbacteria bacterium RIFCSPHIGHO2_01_FULL_46_36]OGY33469.1 MAG: hypothetical protein A3C02_03315 [Candidatus Andersenbacteria bacterium RIFCSPHIGHO2_02_FULL_45_11]OGY34838.1 MAG: hypothetical protein A3D99_02945 [Candidatus Andersenbacteria bacterium RIFCSPHIGHO2_12_FULL_45_11]
MTNILVSLLTGLLPLYVVRFNVFGIPTNVFEVAVWATAASWLAGKTLGVNAKTPSVEETSGFRAIPKSTLIFIALFILSAIISTTISSELRNSLGILKGWIITPILFGLLVHTSTDKKAIIRSLILSGLVVALFGFSQIHGFNRIYSVYDVPNSLALFLVPTSVLAAWLGVKNTDKFYKYAAIVMLIAIVLTQSLGAIVALVGTVIAGTVLASRTHPLQLPLEKGERTFVTPPLFKGRMGGVQKRLFLEIFIMGIIAILFFTLSGRFSYLISPLIHPNTTNSVTVRMQLWDIGAELIKKHPILGIGLGQFEPAYQAELHRRFAEEACGEKSTQPCLPAGRYKLQAEYVFRDPHNWIISFWLNTGLLGLLSFIGLNYIAITKSLPSPVLGEGGGEGKTVYRQAIALAIISILIFGLFDTIYWKNDLSALWWILLAYSLPLI